MESGGEAVTGSETSGAAKGTPLVLLTHQSREVGSVDKRQSPQRTSSNSSTMVKQNGEEYEESAQERMLKDESTQKIAKEATEVKTISLILLLSVNLVLSF